MAIKRHRQDCTHKTQDEDKQKKLHNTGKNEQYRPLSKKKKGKPRCSQTGSSSLKKIPQGTHSQIRYKSCR